MLSVVNIFVLSVPARPNVLFLNFFGIVCSVQVHDLFYLYVIPKLFFYIQYKNEMHTHHDNRDFLSVLLPIRVVAEIALLCGSG